MAGRGVCGHYASIPLLQQVLAKYPTCKKVFADSGYAGELVVRVGRELGIDLEIVKRTDGNPNGAWVAQGDEPAPATGFKLVKWRWVVEPTFGWLGRFRRNSKDYEGTIASARLWIMLSFIWMLVRRLGASAAAATSAVTAG